MPFEFWLACIGLVVWAVVCLEFAAHETDATVEIQVLSDRLVRLRRLDVQGRDAALGVMIANAEVLLANARQRKSTSRNIKAARRIIDAGYERMSAPRR